jgi:hypothetical protein
MSVYVECLRSRKRNAQGVIARRISLEELLNQLSHAEFDLKYRAALCIGNAANCTKGISDFAKFSQCCHDQILIRAMRSSATCPRIDERPARHICHFHESRDQPWLL